MKVSYIKTYDDLGYVINQTIRAENENEKQLLRDCLTNYSVVQKNGSFSAGLKSVSVLRNIISNERVKYRNTIYII